MDKAKSHLDISALAIRLGVAVPTVRKWLWKLDMLPVNRVPTEFSTAKGRRVGVVAFYDESQASKLVKAIKQHQAKRRI